MTVMIDEATISMLEPHSRSSLVVNDFPMHDAVAINQTSIWISSETLRKPVDRVLAIYSDDELSASREEIQCL
jgi:hypothetical protein